MIKCPSPPAWKDRRADVRLLIVILVIAYGSTPQFHGIGLGALLPALAVLGFARPGLADLRTGRARPGGVTTNGGSIGTILVAPWAVVLPVARGNAR